MYDYGKKKKYYTRKVTQRSNTCMVYRVKSGYPCPILDAVDVELHGDVKAVEEVTPKHQSVLRGVYGMDPPCKTTQELPHLPWW